MNYFLPICFSSGRDWEKENSSILNHSIYIDQYKRNRNRLDFTIVYRFQGGKSVRQYNRDTSNEK